MAGLDAPLEPHENASGLLGQFVEIVTIYQLREGEYREVGVSPSFAAVPKERVYRFLRDCGEVGETAAKRSLRAWLRENE
ncbi:MAG: hypothetical protein ACFB4J_15585 [Elainellaceae cyanobacterium]